MKFTILSHAGMVVEDKGRSILFDPWLIGSCYWRSWWNFPEISRAAIKDLKPDYIYLTHLHWDHFHAPSLRLFDEDVKYLVPKIPGTRMVKDLRSIKRKNIVEIPHGGKFELWEDCFLHSFQFGLFSADSTCVISDGETTLFNANDCKIFGLPLRQITKRFPKIDFCFRSHSSATPIPYTIKDYKQNFPDFRTQTDYIEEFTNFCLGIEARYAIPFASNHCFLHKDTYKFNETGVNPQMVADYYNSNESAKKNGSECVIMVPGSSWSKTEGFKLLEFDYANKEQIVAGMQRKYADKYNKQYELEAETKGNFKLFTRYFTKFLDSVPAIVRKKFLPKILFRVIENENDQYWLLDIPNKTISEVTSDTDTDIVISVPAIVINDCVRRRMFSVWGASKRLEIEIKRGGLFQLNSLFSLLDFYENEGLPLKNNFSRRDFGIWLSRWREAFEAFRIIFVYKILRRKFVVSELYYDQNRKSSADGIT